MASNFVCALCYRYFNENSDKSYLLPCRHIFHSECTVASGIGTWVQNRLLPCPVCSEAVVYIQEIGKFDDVEYKAGSTFLNGQVSLAGEHHINGGDGNLASNLAASDFSALDDFYATDSFLLWSNSLSEGTPSNSGSVNWQLNTNSYPVATTAHSFNHTPSTVTCDANPAALWADISNSSVQPLASLSYTTGTLPNPAGTLPKPAGTLPYPTGTLPYPTGTLPNPTGTLPYPAGTLRGPKGTLPNSTATTIIPTVSHPNSAALPIIPAVSLPESKATPFIPTGTLPSSTGTLPTSTGTLPSSTGTLPTSTGTLPTSTGTLPTSTGTLPTSTGTLPTSTGTLINPMASLGLVDAVKEEDMTKQARTQGQLQKQLVEVGKTRKHTRPKRAPQSGNSSKGQLRTIALNVIGKAKDRSTKKQVEPQKITVKTCRTGRKIRSIPKDARRGKVKVESDGKTVCKCKVEGCGYTCLSTSGYYTHRKEVHNYVAEFPCRLCDKTFDRRLNLLEHYNKHFDNMML